MPPERITCFVDGLNLYHAIARLRRPHLKWLDLAALLQRYIRPRSQRIERIYYFSALADWLDHRTGFRRLPPGSPACRPRTRCCSAACACRIMT